MELRSAARANTQIYAIGLDVGGMALEVAQRGFSSMLSNRMSQLGRWSFDGARPAVRLADDLVTHLLERERSSRFERAVIGVAAPAWLGIHERTELADVIDARRRHTLVACTTTMAAVVGSSLVGADPLRRELVLGVDLEVGFSASIVEIGESSVYEWCSVGLSPQHLRGETVGLGIVPGSRQRDRALAELYRQAIELGCAGVGRVVCVGEEPLDDIVRMLADVADVWAECPLDAVRGRSVVARGAAFLADPVGGLDVFDVGSPARAADLEMTRALPDADGIGPTVDGTPGEVTAAAPAWEVTGNLGRRIGVLMDDRDGSPVVHPVIERGVPVPSAHEQLFDLGPDDGSEVYLDLYEQNGLALSDDPVDHRVVATAHLQPSPHRRPEVTVTFELGDDGRFSVEPADMWTLAWHPSEVDILAVQRLMIDPTDQADRSGRVMVRPLIASWAVTSLAPGESTDPTAAVDVALHESSSLPDESVLAQLPDPSDPSDQVDEDDLMDVTSPRDATARPLVRPAPLTPTPAIAAALQRCERLLSYEVGQMVAVRSVFALLDCPDDASPDAVEAAAERLEASMAGRDDDLADAIRVAIAATRRSLADGAEDWYFGGTLADVDAELGRVVEHLMVVVGLVSAAEQRRLVHDAHLLGLGPDRAGVLVRNLVLRAQDERFQAQFRGDDTDASRTVHLHPQLGRFVLDGQGADIARDAVRMRVLLGVR